MVDDTRDSKTSSNDDVDEDLTGRRLGGLPIGGGRESTLATTLNIE